jgi:hypothetical protein
VTGGRIPDGHVTNTRRWRRTGRRELRPGIAPGLVAPQVIEKAGSGSVSAQSAEDQHAAPAASQTAVCRLRGAGGVPLGVCGIQLLLVPS